MNFYIGNSIQQINVTDKNVELDDEMIEYLYSIKDQIKFVAFFTIDLYSDTVVEENDINDIILLCTYVLKEYKLNGYSEIEDIIFAIRELNSLCHNALKQSKKIIAIGD